MNKGGFALLLVSVFLVSCSVVRKINPWHSNNEVKSVSVAASADVNYGYAVEVDVVFVLDENVATPISQLTIQQWFVEGFKEQYESSQQVGVYHIEPMPGYATNIAGFPREYRKAKKVYVFANYLNQRDMKPLEITEVAGVKLVFNKTSFVVENNP